jgi:hypothetical protein
LPPHAFKLELIPHHNNNSNNNSQSDAPPSVHSPVPPRLVIQLVAPENDENKRAPPPPAAIAIQSPSRLSILSKVQMSPHKSPQLFNNPNNDRSITQSPGFASRHVSPGAPPLSSLSHRVSLQPGAPPVEPIIQRSPLRSLNDISDSRRNSGTPGRSPFMIRSGSLSLSPGAPQPFQPRQSHHGKDHVSELVAAMDRLSIPSAIVDNDHSPGSGNNNGNNINNNNNTPMPQSPVMNSPLFMARVTDRRSTRRAPITAQLLDDDDDDDGQHSKSSPKSNNE